MQTFFTSIFLVFCLLTAASAQSATKTDCIRQDSLGSHKARIGSLYVDMKRTGGNGGILFGAPADDPVRRYITERIVLQTIVVWRLQRERISLGFIEGDDCWQESWLTTPGSFDVPIKQIPRDFKLTGQKKSVLIDQDRWVDDELSIPFDLSYLANFLKANPGMTGRLVIFEKSPRKFRRIMFRHVKELTRKYGVNRAQLRFLRRTPRRIEYGYEPSGTDVWLDPPNK